MKIKDIEYFVETAQAASISEAAQRLYITQPSLTKAIQRLEGEIGVPLFLRRQDGVSLTEAGHQILPQARQILEFYQEWLQLGSQNALNGLEIYISRAFSDMFLPRILVQFRQRYPELPVRFEATRNPELFLSRSTRTPVIALFVCQEQSIRACSETQGCGPVILLRGEYRCLISKYSPLARQDKVSLKDLEDLFLVLPGPKVEGGNGTPSVSRIFSEIVTSYPANRIISVESLANVVAEVSENPKTYATSFYPALLRYPQVQKGELVALPFSDYKDPMNLCLFYSKQACRKHPQMAELVTAIQDAFWEFATGLEEPV